MNMVCQAAFRRKRNRPRRGLFRPPAELVVEPVAVIKARLIGASTEAVIQSILKCRKYEVQTYRMCLGVINFSSKYGKTVLEECCSRAIDCGKTTYTFIKNTIPAVAEEIGVKAQKGGTTSMEKGGYVMSEAATDLDKLLSRSKELSDKQKGGER